jgi:Carboxypeptidase regulatory-like domain
MTRRAQPFILILLLFGVARAAQATDAPRKDVGAISGTVVKDPGGEPLKKVLLQFVAEDQKQGGDYSATTDPEGHFHAENVLPGRYRVFMEKTGFVGVNGRGHRADLNTLTVQAGHPLDDLTFRMLPTAVITGRVTDEDGDPISSVRVVVLRKVPGKTKREPVSAEATNDQGEFRASGLFPGQYWIVAMPPPDARDYERQSAKPTAPEEQAETRYLTTYYPGTYDAAQASPVSLKAGDEMPVNFTLIPGRAYRVRGSVTGLPSNGTAGVELISKLGDSIHSGEVSSNGDFEIHGVAPGSYILKASTSDAIPITVRQEVTIGAADVDGLRLVPTPAFRISGRLHLEGQTTADLTQYSVNLRQSDAPEDSGVFIAQDFFGASAPVDRQGNFEWKNVTPGNYFFQIYGGNGKDSFFLKSATMGGRNLDAGFSASGPATIDLVISTKAGTVEGSVTGRDQSSADGDDKPIPNATVVAVPEEKYRKIPSRFGIGSTDQYGHFTIRGLAPGHYALFAWQDLEEDLYYDVDFLKAQGSGFPARVDEDSHQRVDLKLSAISEDWR